MLREETAEEGMLVEDTEKVILILVLILDTEKVELPFSFFLFSFSLPSQESVATDEGFHDESTNDTDPLVKKKIKLESVFDVYHFASGILFDPKTVKSQIQGGIYSVKKEDKGKVCLICITLLGWQESQEKSPVPPNGVGDRDQELQWIQWFYWVE